MQTSGSKTHNLFEETVKTTNDNRIKLIEDTIKWFEQNNIRVTIDHYEFYLILDEAISNAMEHGNQWVVDKHVTVKIFQPVNENIEICISDEGKGFNPMNIPEKANGFDNLSSRGRGIIIIKKFCNIYWNDAGNSVRLVLSIQK